MLDQQGFSKKNLPALYKKILIIAVIIGFLSGAVVLYLRQQSEQLVFEATASDQIHYADDPSIDLGSILIKAFYFVPQDRQDQIGLNWQKNLSGTISELKKFYALQLNNAAKIDFDVYPQPVIGRLNASDYDGSSVASGNPNALLQIQKELTDRVFRSSGDLYQEFFADDQSKSFRVIGILYEGVGSTATILTKDEQSENLAQLPEGSLPAFLASNYYLTAASYKDYGQTIFAHEFGHTLGLPDSYDLANDIPFSDDIMGAGRYRPLSVTYISLEAKKKLGLTY